VQGCQIIIGKTYQKREKLPKLSSKCNKRSNNISRGHKIFQILKNIQTFPLQGPPK
jgi:hypothetical protein